MANVYLKEEHFERMARAIRRRKNVENETYKPGEMAAEIRGLTPPSSGASDLALEDALLNGTVTEIVSENINIIRGGISNQPYLVKVDCSNVTRMDEIIKSNSGGSEKSPRSYTFYNCPELTTINLPSMQSCARLVDNCPNVEVLNLPSFLAPLSNPKYTDIAQNCENLKKIYLPKAQFIGMSSSSGDDPVFINCPKLEAIIINATIASKGYITEIGMGSKKHAFHVGSWPTTGDYQCPYIYVPRVDLATYTEQFPNAAHLLRAIEDYPDITGGA